MLRPLKIKNVHINEINAKRDKDAEIAGAIVDHIFREVGSCVQGDRSKVKLNMFEKGLIGGMLNDKVKNGIKNFILNMQDNDIKNMLNDIEKELSKRKK